MCRFIANQGNVKFGSQISSCLICVHHSHKMPPILKTLIYILKIGITLNLDFLLKY